MRTPALKTFEHGFKRIFFALFRLFLKKGKGLTAPISPSEIRRVLFIRPEKLGDMIISLPVFYNLKKQYPHLELFTICSPRNIAIVRENEHIAGNFLYTKNIFRDLAMIRRVRRLRADVVADMVCDDSVTALCLMQFSSPGAWRIGLGKNRHKDYYDFNYRYRTEDEAHVIDNTLRLLTAFGIDVAGAERHVPPTIPESQYRRADDFIASLNSSRPDNIIGLNISAGRPTRVWQEDKNAELLKRLRGAYPAYHFIISSDPSDRGRAVALAERFESRVHPLPPGLSLLEVSAIISRLKLLITPDTSMVHIARSFNIPVVGLYTRFNRNYTLWRPYGQTGGTVVSGNDYTIHDIGVDDVFTAAVGLLHSEK